MQPLNDEQRSKLKGILQTAGILEYSDLRGQWFSASATCPLPAGLTKGVQRFRRGKGVQVACRVPTGS